MQQKQILIYRTSIKGKKDVKQIKTLFTQFPQICKWNVDLEDWEKILRIECLGMASGDISEALQAIHIDVEELE